MIANNLAYSLSAIFLFTASPATAKDKVVDGWVIIESETKTDCTMATTFEGGTSMLVIWNPRTEVTIFAVFNNDWDSLREKDGETVPLKLEFSGNVEYTNWDDPNAIVTTSDGQSEGVVASWGREHELDFAISFGYSVGVKIEISGRVIGNFNLHGTKRAIMELRRCGARLMKKGGDPFAD